MTPMSDIIPVFIFTLLFVSTAVRRMASSSIQYCAMHFMKSWCLCHLLYSVVPFLSDDGESDLEGLHYIRAPIHQWCTPNTQSVMSAWPPRQLVADSEAWLLFRAGETCRRFLFKGEWVDRSRPSESFGDAKLHHSPCAYAIRYQKATRGH